MRYIVDDTNLSEREVVEAARRDLLGIDFCSCCQQECQKAAWRPEVWCMRCRTHTVWCVGEVDE